MDQPVKVETAKPVETLDAVVIGAGFAGLCMLHKLREDVGLDVRVYDRAGGVGGTWYWNRYPGARSDTESFVYSYSFNRDLYEDWKWSDRYPKQPEILRYLKHVAERFDLNRSIVLNTGIAKAHFNESTNRWDIETDQGGRISAKWLVTGLGLLSQPNLPDIKGLASFAGEVHHTSRWPKTPVDFTGKRVGVIGTGSTGVQLVTAVSSECRHLTVFQRRPQYSVPARHGPVPTEELDHIFADYENYFDRVRRSVTCFGFDESTVPAMSVSAEERERVFEEAWRKGGGFRFMFGTFGDIAVDPRANEEAAKFIRKKIAEIVKDPKKAEILTPRDYYARRPLCDAGYFEAYNRDNVDIVDISKHPILEVVPAGVRTDLGIVELDALLFATGFDAVTGHFLKIDFRGRGGQRLAEKWADGPRANFGLAIAGFPNLFTIYGPPGPFTNQPPAIEWQCQWVAETIRAMEQRGVATLESTPEAEQRWLDDCIAIADGTLFSKLDWWAMGTNAPGRQRTVLFFMGGMGAYIEKLEKATAEGYAGFLQGKDRAAAAA